MPKQNSLKARAMQSRVSLGDAMAATHRTQRELRRLENGLPSCPHDVIDHRSFKDLVLDDMLKRNNAMTMVKLFQTVGDTDGTPEQQRNAAKEFNKVGHLQYLSMLKCRKDRKYVKHLCDIVRQSRHNYVVEPVDIADLTLDDAAVSVARENAFHGETPSAPQNLYTISTVLLQKTMRVPTLILCQINHATQQHIINVFTAPFGQFICNLFRVDIAYDELTRTDCMPERNAITGEFDYQSQVLITVGALRAWSGMLDLLAMPTEYIQAEYMDDDETDIEERIDTPSSHPRAKQQIFIRKVMPKIATMGSVSAESTGTTKAQHERAGHWRRYRNGRKVWVRACIAGDPTKGSTVGIDRTVEVVSRK